MAIYDVNEIDPDLVVEGITDEQCESLKNNTGLDPAAGKKNCEIFNEELIPLLSQELNAILKGSDINVFANNESKCADDKLPTQASMWSRIYRFSQALTCILCAYDPFLSTLLKSGRYPQVLMAAEGSEYPVWQTPDTNPRKGSQVPVTSDGVYNAIRSAVMSVWHIWEEHPEFDYYVEDYADLADLDKVNGTKVLVKNGQNGKNEIYTYDTVVSDWVSDEVVGVELPNFTVTHIKKGYYAGKEIYYMRDGSEPVWSLMDAELKDIEQRLENVEGQYERTVKSQDDSTNYLLTTRATLGDALAVGVTPGKTTIVLITE